MARIQDIIKTGRAIVASAIAPEPEVEEMEAIETTPEPIAEYQSGGYVGGFGWSYDGEKNLGELGPLKDYTLDFDRLRIRAWQSYLTSPITRIFIDKYVEWVIGTGLKLQAEPQLATLKSEGIQLDTKSFSDAVEARFATWANSRHSSFSGCESLLAMSKGTYKNAKIGGDILVVLRLAKNEIPNVQLIDGAHVQNPLGKPGTDTRPYKMDNGNTLRNGIETNKNGEIVRYHIRKSYNDHSTIEAKNKQGLVQAYLVKGDVYRLNNSRGVTSLATILETLAKLDRYQEAAVGGAEITSSLVYQIVHDLNASGESPMMAKFARANGRGDASAGGNLPVDENGIQLANQVRATTTKESVNMPPGSKIQPVESSNGQLQFKEFYGENFKYMSAAQNLPPEVALDSYDSNYSASRAAIKAWEQTFMNARLEFSRQFYEPIYHFWLHSQILLNKIQAPGYLKAFTGNNVMAIEAYTSCRFTGKNAPQIDPLKEIKAIREMLGESAKNLPLVDLNAAIELLGNGGDAETIMRKYAEMLLKSEELGIPAAETPSKDQPLAEDPEEVDDED